MPAPRPNLSALAHFDALAIHARLNLESQLWDGAMRNTPEGITPKKQYRILVANESEVTASEKKVAGNALTALLMPIPLPMLMDRSDADYSLKLCVEKVTTRAGKRKAEQEARDEREEERNRAVGAACAAKRARVVCRPVKANSHVDNTCFRHRWE